MKPLEVVETTSNGKRITWGWLSDHKKCFAFTSSRGASLDRSSTFKLETTFIPPSMLSKRIDSKTTPRLTLYMPRFDCVCKVFCFADVAFETVRSKFTSSAAPTLSMVILCWALEDQLTCPMIDIHRDLIGAWFPMRL